MTQFYGFLITILPMILENIFYILGSIAFIVFIVYINKKTKKE